MRLGLLGRGFALTDAIALFAEKRLLEALARYSQAVSSAKVRLADVNGPRGGVDKHCLIEVRGPAFEPIVVRERNADLYVAIARAADRVEQTVGRRLGRSQDVDRRASRSSA